MERNKCFDCCYCSEHYPNMKDICDKDEHEIKDVFEFEEVCEDYVEIMKGQKIIRRKNMSRNSKMPWSMTDTIKNMEQIRNIMLMRVREINLNGKAEEDVRKINFNFDRVKEVLEMQIPKKPIREPWSIAKCPNCSCELGEWLEDGYHKDYDDKRVCDCGQKLDWDLT